jgi:hypothetical protein
MKLSNEYILTIKSGSLSRKIKRDFPDDYQNIVSMSTIFTFKENTYMYLNPTAHNTCKTCNNHTKIFRYSSGFTEYCSAKCRGRAVRPLPKLIPTVSKLDVTYWPLHDTIVEISKNANYCKSQIKREFFEFYCYIVHAFSVANFNEKLHLYLNNGQTGVCKVCNSLTKFTPSKFTYNEFCSKRCANNYNRIYLTGGYNSKYFDQYPAEKHTPAYLYFIELFNEDERFLKIGITCRDFKYRRNEICGAKYNVSVLEIKKMTLYRCHLLETSIKNSIILQKYMPLQEISGKTECFNINEKETICKLI